ncbi:MAG TPA: prephenate dehydrogenase/arogenate dehydrogenase family protein [Pyrinomonadaceae bacterium]|nr:prephenate dehydrogenase/arogenate dehydrogenase family protein [Pyrinomonadaceae bacterium]
MTAEPIWERATVVGCGLVGASFALALRRAGACARVAGWDTDASALEEALRLGAIEEVDAAFASGGVSASDLVYLATPVGHIVEFLRAGAPQVGPGAVLTDAGSTKVEICRAARAFEREGLRFVGGHPIAGSHLSGPAHARADLFEGAPYVLTPFEDGDALALVMLEETLRRIGARVHVTTAEEHDRALALVSHLPQLASGALAATVGASPDADALRTISGAGFRDMTRLAESSWAVWRDILATNSAEVADALDVFINRLSAVRDELRDGRLNLTSALFDHARHDY